MTMPNTTACRTESDAMYALHVPNTMTSVHTERDCRSSPSSYGAQCPLFYPLSACSFGPMMRLYASTPGWSNASTSASSPS